jgi:hypothetical protein
MNHIGIVDAAVDVAVFSRTHGYPESGTPDFFRFAELLDKLSTEIAKQYPAFSSNIQLSAKKP